MVTQEQEEERATQLGCQNSKNSDKRPIIWGGCGKLWIQRISYASRNVLSIYCLHLSVVASYWDGPSVAEPLVIHVLVWSLSHWISAGLVRPMEYRSWWYVTPKANMHCSFSLVLLAHLLWRESASMPCRHSRSLVEMSTGTGTEAPAKGSTHLLANSLRYLECIL